MGGKSEEREGGEGREEREKKEAIHSATLPCFVCCGLLNGLQSSFGFRYLPPNSRELLSINVQFRASNIHLACGCDSFCASHLDTKSAYVESECAYVRMCGVSVCEDVWSVHVRMCGVCICEDVWSVHMWSECEDV